MPDQVELVMDGRAGTFLWQVMGAAPFDLPPSVERRGRAREKKTPWLMSLVANLWGGNTQAYSSCWWRRSDDTQCFWLIVLFTAALGWQLLHDAYQGKCRGKEFYMHQNKIIKLLGHSSLHELSDSLSAYSNHSCGFISKHFLWMMF